MAVGLLVLGFGYVDVAFRGYMYFIFPAFGSLGYLSLGLIAILNISFRQLPPVAMGPLVLGFGCVDIASGGHPTYTEWAPFDYILNSTQALWGSE